MSQNIPPPHPRAPAPGILECCLAVLRAALRAMIVLGAACWLCIYPVLMVAAGLLVMTGVPQGNELLKWTADSRDGQITFYVTVMIWATSAWYCSRVLLDRRFTPFGSAALEADEPFPRFVRVWLPRVLGVWIFVGLALHFWRELDEPRMALIIFVLGVAFTVFVLSRRAVMQRVGRASSATVVGVQTDRLPRATIAWLIGWLIGALALFIAFNVSEVWLPRQIGAAPIILLAFTGWILFGSILLVLLPKAYGLTSMALLPLLFVAAASTTDNHAVRTLAATESYTVGESPAAKAFILWLATNPAFKRAVEEGKTSFPVYVATAEGGGLRAGYWAATVLGELEAATDGRFSQHLFAISGVSGGSLGGAAYVAAVNQSRPCTGAPDDSRRVRNCVSHYLNADFLSPVVAYLLFPDLVQRFLPVTIRHFDRARAIESAWETSWRELNPDSGDDTFGQPFKAVARNTPKGGLAPLLFFNATKVETGERVLVASVPIDVNEFPEVRDPFRDSLKNKTLRLSTAVHLSARFTYVSPAGKVCKDDREDCDLADMWGRVVDGGYHENSGALTAQDILRVIQRAVPSALVTDPTTGRKIAIEPRVIIITNDPGSARMCEAFAPDRDKTGKPTDPQKRQPNAPRKWLSELLSPLDALLNTRVARGTHARRTVADTAAGATPATMEADCKDDGARANVLEFAMPDGESPALGWFLGKASRQLMHDALCRDEHVKALETARVQVVGSKAGYVCERNPRVLTDNPVQAKVQENPAK